MPQPGDLLFDAEFAAPDSLIINNFELMLGEPDNGIGTDETLALIPGCRLPAHLTACPYPLQSTAACAL